MHELHGARRMRSTIVCCVLGSSTVSFANPLPSVELRPITEMDVYADMARFWELAGMDEAVIVRAGGGIQEGALGTFDLAYRSSLRGWRELLPNTFATGVWAAERGMLVPFSIGWQLELGIFSAPYVTANALGTWSPASAEVALGFDVGAGYEWRQSISWAIGADVRVQRLWAIDEPMGVDREPWGVRATLSVRRYFSSR